MYKLFLLILLSISLYTYPIFGCKYLFKESDKETENISLQTDREIYIAGENIFYKVFIYSNLPESLTSNFCYLVVRDMKNTFLKSYIKLDNQSHFGLINLPDTLKTGYYEIVAFTNYMKNEGEERFARKQVLIVNRFDKDLRALNYPNNDNNSTSVEETTSAIPIKIKLEKDSFETRENIHLKIIQSPELNNYFKNSLSLTIKEKSGYSTKCNLPENRTNYTTLGKFKKEISGIFLEGTIVDDKSVPLPLECLFISTPDSIANLQYTFSDNDGRFKFYITDYYLEKPLIICLRNKNSNYQIRLDDKFQLFNKFNPTFIRITDNIKKYIIESQKLVTLQKSFVINNTKTIPIPKVKANHIGYLYTNPSLSVIPSQFEYLANMQEIIENILPDVKIRKNNVDYFPYVTNFETGQYFNAPATIFFNGIPVYNLNPILEWGSSSFRKIEIINKIRIKGDISFNGIIAIYSDKLVENEIFIPNLLKFTTGRFPDQTTYAPTYYSKKTSLSHIPDFRQLLYWNPSLSLNSPVTDIEFFSSDWTGKYTIELIGTDSNGESFKIVSDFKIYE